MNLDYTIFHKTGKKVENFKREKMDVDEKRNKELLISEDIDEFFRIYELDELDAVDELNESIEFVTELSNNYRHIHIELKNIMGDEKHDESYKKFETILENLRNFQKDAKNKRKILKKHAKEMEENKLMGKFDEAKRELRTEEEIFREKLEIEFDDFELRDVVEIKEACDKLDKRLDDYYILLGKIKNVFGNEYEVFGDVFKTTISRIVDQGKILPASNNFMRIPYLRRL